jgi:hypothetical protein
MPTQRAHGGAQLVPINLTAPGFGGLNTEAAGSILNEAWATKLDNAIFDAAGRPALRKGFLSITTTPVAGVPKRIFEYYKADGTSELLFSTDANIFSGTTAPSSVKGTLTISDGNIKFVNFNDKCIAFGIGTSGLPAVYTGSTFADITVNSQAPGSIDPEGTIGTAAFGRLWLVGDNGKTLYYSALLDETRWAVADGGGLIDFSNVWPAGQDSIVAVEEFGGDLVVWGKNNTVIMTDGAGASLGIDPDSMYVSDTIPGLGAISQFAMTRAAGDFWFLSNSGLVGLRRELVQRSTAFNNISQNVQGQINEWIQQETDFDDLTLVTDLKNDFVVAVFPAAGAQMVFDTRRSQPVLEQEQTFRATSWSAPLQTLAYIRDSQDLYGSFAAVAGEILQYTGESDNGSSYFFDYESGWLNLGQEASQYLKFVKYLSSFVLVEQNVDVIHKIGYDFGKRDYSIVKSASGNPSAEYGTAEWGTNGVRDNTDATLVAGTDIAEYSGSFSLKTLKAPGRGSGQFIKVGIRLDTASGDFALQQINLYAKIGRMAV